VVSGQGFAIFLKLFISLYAIMTLQAPIQAIAPRGFHVMSALCASANAVESGSFTAGSGGDGLVIALQSFYEKERAQAQKE
jgi:hypothetical protein